MPHTASFKCPRCGFESYNANDLKHRYCVRCHLFADDLPIRVGDQVRLTVEGQTVTGSVILASPNGRSLAVEFEAILAGAVGMLPVLQSDNGQWQDLMGRAVELRVIVGRSAVGR